VSKGSIKYIQRYTLPSGNGGWRMCIHYDSSGENRRFIKRFLDKRYGDKKQSLEAAKEYRRYVTEDVLGLPEMLNEKSFYGNIRQKVNAQNNTGFAGVTVKIQTDVNGRETFRYQARVGIGRDIEYTKSFAVKKYGSATARQMAIDWRDEKLLELGLI